MSPATGTANKIGIRDIAFTAYSVKDMDRARAFYEGVLGLTPAQSIGPFWQEYTIGNATLAIIGYPEDKIPDFYKGRSWTLALEVADLDKAFAALKDSDAQILMEPSDNPGCRSFVVRDPDDNVITFHQLKH